MTDVIKKCLLIGINYTGTRFQLNGCINDSNNIRRFMTSNGYFEDSHMIMMNDTQSGSLYPTKVNIMKKLNDLLNLALYNKNKNMQYFIGYSGHGSNLVDKDGDEDDGYDECLCPIDCDTEGFITDDYIRTEFIEKLPKNVTIISLIDACHSGTILDLKYNYAIDRKNSYNAIGIYKNVQCTFIMISGCKDNQTSADAYLSTNDFKPKQIESNEKEIIEPEEKTETSGVLCDCENCLKNKSQSGGKKSLINISPLFPSKYEYTGAMTASFLASFQNNITYTDLVTNMRSWLSKKSFKQLPQLSSSNVIDTKSNFLLSSYK
jgi:metacaspase-1